MQRRDFCSVLATAALARAVRAADPPKDVRITRAVGFDLPCKRSKVAGRNARLDVHGDRTNDRMVRLYTNTGIEALGNCRADEKAIAQLIGGMSVALYTTLVGSVLHIWLVVNHRILTTGTINLYSAIVELGENRGRT